MARKYLIFAWDFWGGSPESVEPIPPSSRHPQPIQPRQPLSKAVDQDSRDLGVMLTSEYRVARPTWLSARYRVFCVVGLHVRQASLILPTTATFNTCHSIQCLATPSAATQTCHHRRREIEIVIGHKLIAFVPPYYSLASQLASV